jgi:uncharacterized membrane protein YcaP (DUF421 family)
VLAYGSLVVLLRASGNRTLSKMNAFDFVVTVALGSALASSLLSDRVTVAQVALAFAVLIGLQLLITWSSSRAAWVKRLVTGEPSLLLYQGEILPTALRRSRVTPDEVAAAVRSAGLARPEEAGAVVLETDGSFSVVPRRPGEAPPRVAGVEVPARVAGDTSA